MAAHVFWCKMLARILKKECLSLNNHFICQFNNFYELMKYTLSSKHTQGAISKQCRPLLLVLDSKDFKLFSKEWCIHNFLGCFTNITSFLYYFNDESSKRRSYCHLIFSLFDEYSTLLYFWSSRNIYVVENLWTDWMLSIIQYIKFSTNL